MLIRSQFLLPARLPFAGGGASIAGRSPGPLACTHVPSHPLSLSSAATAVPAAVTRRAA